MKILKLKRDFKDNRGFISDLFYQKKIKHISLIFSKKGSIRGNNYFKKNYQYIFNLGNSFEYWYKRLGQKKLKKKIIKKDQLLLTPPFEVHALKIFKSNKLLEFSTLSIKQKKRLKDSVKIKIL